MSVQEPFTAEAAEPKGFFLSALGDLGGERLLDSEQSTGVPPSTEFTPGAPRPLP